MATVPPSTAQESEEEAPSMVEQVQGAQEHVDTALALIEYADEIASAMQVIVGEP